MLQLIGLILIAIAVIDSGYDMAYNLQTMNGILNRVMRKNIIQDHLDYRHRRAEHIAKNLAYYVAFIFYDMILLVTVYVAYRTAFNFTLNIFTWDIVFFIIAIINYYARKRDKQKRQS